MKTRGKARLIRCACLPALMFGALICRSAIGEVDTDVVTASNMVRQTSSQGTNYFLGNVGIGTNDPAYPLDVAGSVRITGAMKVPKQGDVAMGTYTNGESVNGISGAEGNCLWVTNAAGDVYVVKKIGIGTNAPSESLEVVGNIKAGGNLEVVSNLVVNGSITGRGALDMGTNLISNLLDPVNNQDAATKKWVNDNYLSSETDPSFTGWLGTNTYVKVEADPAWGAVSNQYAKTNEVVRKLLSGSGITLSPSNGQGEVTVNSTIVGLTNAIGSNTYVNTGFDLQPGSNITFRSNSNGVNFVDGSGSAVNLIYDGASTPDYSVAYLGYPKLMLTTNMITMSSSGGTLPTMASMVNAIDGDFTSVTSTGSVNAQSHVINFSLPAIYSGVMALKITTTNPTSGQNVRGAIGYGTEIQIAAGLLYGGAYEGANQTPDYWDTDNGKYTRNVVKPFVGSNVWIVINAGTAAQKYWIHEFTVWAVTNGYRNFTGSP